MKNNKSWQECKLNPKNWSDSFVAALVGVTLVAAAIVVSIGAVALQATITQ